MKELSTEEKAKAYDGNYKAYTELINCLEDVKDAIKKQNYGIAMDILCKPYPEYQIITPTELKRSEDEAVRGTLYEYFKRQKDNGDVDETWYGVSYDKILSWLEKQGDIDRRIQEEIEKQTKQLWKAEKQCEPKFRVGDVIRPKGSTAHYTIESIYGECYHGKGWELHTGCENDYELVEHKPAWSEEDESMLQNILECLKNGWRKLPTDVLKYESWFQTIKDRVQPQSKYEWKQENTDALTDFENVMMHIGISFFGQHAGLNPNDTNAIKEQANILLGLVPKQEWSEEDENRFRNLIYLVEHNEKSRGTKQGFIEFINRLKSLKERYTWKPSEEQIATFWDAICNLNHDGYKWIDDLKSLFQDLKKLSGE